MFDILRFFIEDKVSQAANGIVVYDFKDVEKNAFVQYIKDFYRVAFISDDDLNENIAGMGTSRKEEIEAVIPTDPIIQSGDFGEILAYAIFTQLNPEYNFKPLKWRWKEERDKAVHFADIILLSCPDYTNPLESDKMMTIEVKTRATRPGKDESSVNKAIVGALNDSVSRGGKTLLFLQQRLKKDKDYEGVKLVKRFEETVLKPYEEYHHAIAIVERNFYSTHHIGNLDQKLITEVKSYNNRNSPYKKYMGVFLAPFAELKKLYEDLYTEIKHS
jgi:hypothetical protein